MAQHDLTAHPTPQDYFTEDEPAGQPPAASGQAPQQAQQPVRLFNPVPTPGAATERNMVAQQNLLPAVPGGHKPRGAKRLSRSRSPSATPPRGRWAINSPPSNSKRTAPQPGPASDPGPGSEADHSAPPTMPKARTKATTKSTNRDWAQELTQTRRRILGMDTPGHRRTTTHGYTKTGQRPR